MSSNALGRALLRILGEYETYTDDLRDVLGGEPAVGIRISPSVFKAQFGNEQGMELYKIAVKAARNLSKRHKGRGFSIVWDSSSSMLIGSGSKNNERNLKRLFNAHFDSLLAKSYTVTEDVAQTARSNFINFGHEEGVLTTQTTKALEGLAGIQAPAGTRGKGLVLQAQKILRDTSKKLNKIDIEGTLYRKVSPKGFEGELTIGILEDAALNKSKGARAGHEKKKALALLRAVQDSAIQLLDLEGSPSIRQTIFNAVQDTFDNGAIPTTVYTSTAKKSKERKQPKTKGRNTKLPPLRMDIPVVGESMDKLRDSKGRFTSLMKIQTLLAAGIQEAVAANMNRPHLNYRTGRFANSVEIALVSQTRYDTIDVFYTYQKNPYQTFEPGYRQGHLDYDPRILIDKSIRQIAIGLVTKQLRTVRV